MISNLLHRRDHELGSDMETGFKFDLLYRDNDLVKVRVSAGNSTFGGTADVYLRTGQLGELASQLQGFPKTLSDTRQVLLGTFDPESAGGGVSMRFYCVDRSGHIRVETKIESDGDSAGRVQSAMLLVPIEPGAIDLFVEDLRGLDAGVTATACLRATVTSQA
jgi:hypothetical protein